MRTEDDRESKWVKMLGDKDELRNKFVALALTKRRIREAGRRQRQKKMNDGEAKHRRG